MDHSAASLSAVSAAAARAAAAANTVTQHPVEPPATILFEAVVQGDYDRLLRLFASNAHTSIRSYLSMRQRWGLNSCGSAKSIDPYKSEEKNDDFIREIPFERFASASGSSSPSSHFDWTSGNGSASPRYSPGTTARKNEDAAYSYLLQELTKILAPDADAIEVMAQSMEVDGDLLSSSSFASFQPPAASEEADRLVWDASAHLSDSRPPADFLVYKKDGTFVLETNSLANGNIDAMDVDPPAVPTQQQPPVFDGSVANATPPPPGGSVGGASGGAGTILHLACAMDLPLVLAFCLAMGADARATHTAFRRLMVHEAACNGSVKCLTLLLELGQEYARQHREHEEQNKHIMQPNIMLGGSGWRSHQPHLHSQLTQQTRYSEDSVPRAGREQSQLPFFPSSIGSRSVPVVSPSNSTISSSSSSSSQSSSTPPSSERRRPDIGMNLRHFRRSRQLRRHVAQSSSSDRYSTDVNRQQETTRTTNRQRDLLSTLRQFQSLLSLVRDGSLSDIDAARTLLKDATLSESSRMSLVRSCAFSASVDTSLQCDSVEFSHVLLHGNGCADGHGNTPLHWAAFKNEVACVSMLLEFHADPNARAHPSGWTPLHDAAYSNSSESVALLIDHGAHVDARANSGATPLCFAAQEDAEGAAQLLLNRGADLTARCAGPNRHAHQLHPGHPQSRFSGYTPLHYCAHYNAHGAARVLLQHKIASIAMETPDLSDRLPIHIAVARGSSDVLRELLHAGARIDTRPGEPAQVPSVAAALPTSILPGAMVAAPRSPARRPPTPERPLTPSERARSGSSLSSGGSTPVSSPLLRSMIPSQPVMSSKPWNCLSQRAIDECRDLIHKAEQSWAPDRHLLFTPQDRKAVMELLRVGKRLEQQGTGIFLDLWPLVLSFCGRGWFDKAVPLTITATSESSKSTEDANSESNLMLPQF